MRHLLRRFTGSAVTKVLGAALLMAASVQLGNACATFRLREFGEEGNQTVCRLKGTAISPEGQTYCMYSCYSPVFQ